MSAGWPNGVIVLGLEGPLLRFSKLVEGQATETRDKRTRGTLSCTSVGDDLHLGRWSTFGAMVYICRVNHGRHAGMSKHKKIMATPKELAKAVLGSTGLNAGIKSPNTPN